MQTNFCALQNHHYYLHLSYSIHQHFCAIRPMDRIKGNNTINKNGIYGLLGKTDTNTDSGSMREGVNWTDFAGNFPT